MPAVIASVNMAIYTKTGDKGETSLLNPDQSLRRVKKNSFRVWAIGSLDEVNCYLGITITSIKDSIRVELLEEVQRDIFTLNSILAGADLSFEKTRIQKLEKIIDTLEGKLPPLSNFILPGGSIPSAHLQFCRALTRRAERDLVALSQEEEVPAIILQYVNRLSDFFFMLARDENKSSGLIDTPWQGRK